MLALLALLAAIQAAPPPERLTLLQLTLSGPDRSGAAARRDALAAAARRITSCESAVDEIARFRAAGHHGTFDVRDDVPLAALPAPLRAALTAHPRGRATPIYGDGLTLRMLVGCAPGFRLPAPARHA